MELKRIRVTQLGMAKRCEKSLFYSVTQPKPKMTIPFFIGSIFHEVMRCYFEKQLQGSKLSQKGVLELLEGLWQAKKGELGIDGVNSLKALQRAKDYVSIYYRDRVRFLIPLYIEKHLEMVVRNEGQEIRITGDPDLITTAMIIVDHKTSKGNWNDEKANKEIQAQLYPLLAKANNINIKGFEFSVISEKDVQIFPVEFNQEKTNKWLLYALELQKNWAENNLLITGSKFVCRLCQHKNICLERRENG